MTKVILYIIASVILYLLPTCCICQQSINKDDNSSLSSIHWKSDTLGMNGYRARMKDKINDLEGRSKDEIKDFLGNPDLQGVKSGATYFIYFFEYYLSPSYRRNTATQSRIDLQNGVKDTGSLGSIIILEFDRDDKLSGARIIWED